MRTLKHPAARFAASGRRQVYSFDCLDKKNADFDQVCRVITGILLKASQKHEVICYAVPGPPNFGEATVGRLRKIAPRLGIKVDLVAGLSFLEPLLSHLDLDLPDGITVIDALSVAGLKEPSRHHLILAQVYNRKMASQVKLKLLNLYPADYPVVVINAAGLKGVKTFKTTLRALDHRDLFDHLTALYLSPYSSGSIGELLAIMARLRAADGCPWDRRQNHRSLRQYLVEEAYEVVAAIDSNDDRALIDELGDLLLQVVFHSQIAGEEKRFNFFQVVDSINRKLVRRHPHVFGSENAADVDAVKAIWEEIKAVERNERKSPVSIDVDLALPALLRAFKLQKKAAAVGFDWPDIEGPLKKTKEELAELEGACSRGDWPAMEDELGDFLFSVVNLARFLKVNPEIALGKTAARFSSRFSYVLEQVEKSGKPWSAFTLETLDFWWEEAKNIEKIRQKKRSMNNDVE